MKMLTVTNFRNKLKEYLEKIGEGYAIVKNEEPVAVVISIEEYRALLSMAYLANDPGRLTQVEKDNNKILTEGPGSFNEIPGL